MGRARKDIPTLTLGNKIYPEDLAIGNPWANYWYVDGDNGSDSTNTGNSVDRPTATIAQAIANAGRGDVIFVRALAMANGATDPESYEENLTIPVDMDMLSIVGVGTGRTQGGLPQLKDGATTTQEILRVRAPGCAITNLGFNGAGNTGGGILIDESVSGYTAFGLSIENCHFKNCKGSTANNAATGGAIMWTSNGGAWQVLISGNRFYKCVGDVVLKGTGGSVPQDVVIQDNSFSGPASTTDCNLYLEGGSGMNGVTIDNNVFQQLPALGGTHDRYIKATGCIGMLTNNMFGATVAEGEGEVTFQADGTAAFIPTTMHMAGNYGQYLTGVGAGKISGEIYG